MYSGGTWSPRVYKQMDFPGMTIHLMAVCPAGRLQAEALSSGEEQAERETGPKVVRGWEARWPKTYPTWCVGVHVCSPMAQFECFLILVDFWNAE